MLKVGEAEFSSIQTSIWDKVLWFRAMTKKDQLAYLQQENELTQMVFAALTKWPDEESLMSLLTA
jgi:hypothetical protein